MADTRIILAATFGLALASCGAAQQEGAGPAIVGDPMAAQAPVPPPPPPPPPLPPPPPMMERKVGEAAAVDAAAVEAVVVSGVAGGATGGAPASGPAASPAAAPMLAYMHQVTLSAPAREVAPLMARHQAACIAAGPAQCQVVGSSTNALGENTVSAMLSIRGEPKWLATFRDGLDADARKADGRVTARSVSSEDLTRQMTDTDAYLRAQTALRTRLEALLASRPGRLGELLEIERELARVRGEIDAAQSNLAIMRARVAMSTLDLSYQSQSAPVVEGTFAPLTNAIDGFIGTLAAGFGAIITLIAFLLPWLIVLIPAGWLGARWLRRRREAKAAAKAAP